MPSLTTIDGLKFTFSSKTVAVVADHDAATNELVTSVYGVGKGMLRIRESVLNLLNRLGIIGKFAKLTRPNGTPVWINASSVSAVRAPIPDDVFPDQEGAVYNAFVITSAITQGVRETLDQAAALLRDHGGDV